MIQHSCSARVQWPRLADFRMLIETHSTLNEKTEKKKGGDGLRWKRIQTKIKSFIFQIIFKIRIHHQTRSRTLKLINWFIAEYFTPLFSCFRASEVLRTPDFALNFGCFQVADYENWFCRFSPNRSGLLINKLHHV